MARALGGNPRACLPATSCDHAGCHFCNPIQVTIDADTQRYPVITQRHMQVAVEAEVAALEAENARLKQVLSATAAGTLSRPPSSNPKRNLRPNPYPRALAPTPILGPWPQPYP